MKVKYKGSAQSINNNDTYTVLDRCGYTDRYKIRDDYGRVEWYAISKFVEVKEKVDTSTAINSDLVNKIQRELKETEERLGVLRKELENAKNPPTKNILERATRKLGSDWEDDVSTALENLSEALANTYEFNEGIALDITREGDGIVLDRDYDWNITYRNGFHILLILDK
jgi:DNA-binding ferritin-like protein (Dps family)